MEVSQLQPESPLLLPLVWLQVLGQLQRLTALAMLLRERAALHDQVHNQSCCTVADLLHSANVAVGCHFGLRPDTQPAS